ncbi:ABC transporter ATP-binding protein [Streptomyces gilvus]|uniref:ABC transporter ATP-binding protein n=1 Tax=Streptomyces gilvus TaxID=2920937 RepID=UPI001F1030C2|nr:ATP-binding cassette domain-containing protein [Streptomyces sp. CME 23]MCH5676856.1 ATP-binding cassette domain-containing protein [Streptomyces sp. CME 23]
MKIEVADVTKRYGEAVAVSGLTFTVEPGRVTGFLGPNGSGKSTTMRMILGLDTPDRGDIAIGGHRYRGLVRPMHQVGALLDATAVHPARTGTAHLRALACANGIAPSRVDALLEQVGLGSVARRRVGGYSLGMKQRLGIAGALLGDPSVLMFDEPVNGLDPEGVRWLRDLLRDLAAEGRTVLVSSHLLSEMSQTADHLIVIGRGRLIADTSTQDFIADGSAARVIVRAPYGGDLARVLIADGAAVEARGDGTLAVTDLTAARIGHLAHEAGLELHELRPDQASLEEAFMQLTADAVEHRALAAELTGER